MKILTQKFFEQPTLVVAKELLGKFLVRKIGRREISGIITEVEAYIGHQDKASHASKGKTERTKVMFGKPGYWYVYLIYGMHYCLNIVTEKNDYPAAILIRSVGVKNIEKYYLVRGPGRLTKFFQIDKKLNGKPASRKTGLWIEDKGVKIKPEQIKHGKRVGVDYAGKWKNKLWRFYLDACLPQGRNRT